MILLFDKTNQSSKQALWDYLKELPDKAYLIEIKLFRKTRSNAQNRYYWGVLVKMIAEETGHEPEEVHEVLKNMFIPDKIVEFDKKGNDSDFFDHNTGEVFEMTEKHKTIKTTVNLGTDKFDTYMEDGRRWAAIFLNLNIPDPSGNYLQI